MIALLCFVLTVLAAPFKSKSRLEAENAALRHQLIVLRRKVHGRVQLTNNDRWFFIQLYRWFPSIKQVLTIVRPETLVRWHRAGFRCYWRWRSCPLGGRPQIKTEVRALIRQMIREPALGSAAHPRRAPQARVRGRPVERRKVHGQAAWTAKPRMAHFPAQSCPRYRRHGLVRCPDHWLRPALWFRHRAAGS